MEIEMKMEMKNLLVKNSIFAGQKQQHFYSQQQQQQQRNNSIINISRIIIAYLTIIKDIR